MPIKDIFQHCFDGNVFLLNENKNQPCPSAGVCGLVFVDSYIFNERFPKRMKKGHGFCLESCPLSINLLFENGKD